MPLNVRETADLMGVSEKTVRRWVRENKLPAVKINGQYRFDRIEMLEWATSQRMAVPADIFREPGRDKTPMPSLAEALKAGGIHYRVGGKDRDSVLKSAVDVMALPEGVDRSFLLRVLVARESLGSTGVGDGIAIPHVRNPIVMYVPRPIVTLCFLEHAVAFGAVDGKPIHTLFTLVSPTISLHLSLLAKLAFALRHPDFAGVIARVGTREEILTGASSIDGIVLRRSGTAEEGRGET